MNTFEIYLSVGSIVFTVVVCGYLWHVSNTVGKRPTVDPERLKSFIENAPYENLDRVMKPGWRNEAPGGAPSKARVKRVFALAVGIMGSKVAAEEWMNTPVMELDDRKPSHLMATSAGADLVENFLKRLDVIATPDRFRRNEGRPFSS